MGYPRKWNSETSLVDENDWNAVCDHINETKEGTATISAGDTEVTVTHSKGTTNYPTVTPIQDMGGRRWWVPEANVGDDSFKIKIDSADFGDLKFYYRC